MQFLVVMATLLTAASAQIVSGGQCADVNVVRNFDVASYAGVWFEIYRYSTEFQPNGDCVTANYALNAAGNVTVNNRMVANGTVVAIQGTADLADPESDEGKLFVNFPTASNANSDYWVLATDYKGYSLVYSCTNLSNNNKKVSTWILSRTKTLSPQAVVVMDSIISVVSGLSWDNYRETSQSEESCRIARTSEN